MDFTVQSRIKNNMQKFTVRPKREAVAQSPLEYATGRFPAGIESDRAVSGDDVRPRRIVRGRRGSHGRRQRPGSVRRCRRHVQLSTRCSRYAANFSFVLSSPIGLRPSARKQQGLMLCWRSLVYPHSPGVATPRPIRALRSLYAQCHSSTSIQSSMNTTSHAH